MEKKNLAEENPFNRLPDEVLIIIFNKILDLKTLLYCSLLSKHFNSLVLQIHTLFIKLPSACGNQNSNQEENEDKSLKDQFSEFFRMIRKFVGNFREIRSIHIEFPPSGGCCDSVVRWMAEFGAGLEILVILFSESVRRMTENAQEKTRIDHENEIEDGEGDGRPVPAEIRRQLWRVVRDLWTVRQMVATELNGRAKVQMRGKNLVELSDSFQPLRKRCIMEEAILMIVKPKRSGGDAGEINGDNDDDVALKMRGLFEGKEVIFGVAAIEWLMKHKRLMKRFYLEYSNRATEHRRKFCVSVLT